jgi:hypothetical protein
MSSSSGNQVSHFQSDLLLIDDLGQMCFNPAKLWQLQHYPHPVTVIGNWYDPRDFITVDVSSGAQVYEMIGIGEYNLQKGKTIRPFVMKYVLSPAQLKFIASYQKTLAKPSFFRSLCLKALTNTSPSTQPKGRMLKMTKQMTLLQSLNGPQQAVTPRPRSRGTLHKANHFRLAMA